MIQKEHNGNNNNYKEKKRAEKILYTPHTIRKD